MARNIVELNVDGISYTNRPFGTCNSAGDDSMKVVECADFVLVQNATILVKFTNKNTVLSPTLNVNSTNSANARPIVCNIVPYIGDNIKAGGIYEFIYDGSKWWLLGGIDTDTNDRVIQNPITTPVNRAQPLLMLPGPSTAGTVRDAVQYHEGLTYNPSTKTLGLGVLNCTTNDSDDNINIIDIFANRQLATTFRIMFPDVTGENIAPATRINLAYSGPGLTGLEAKSSNGLTIGPKIVNDTTTNGFLISTDKPLHIEAQGVTFGSEVHAESFKGTADSARLTPYGVCSTASQIAAKTVQETSVPFTLETGARISVKFDYYNTASNMTLNVKSTGAKDVYLNGSPVDPYVISPNNIYDFIYDGEYWQLQPGVNYGAASSDKKTTLYLIGTTEQSQAGARTYSNSDVYTTGGAIYTKGGFYDMSATAGASVYKAVVPKDYTEGVDGSSLQGTHTPGGMLSASISVPSPKFGGLVYECPRQVGSTTTLALTPSSANTTFRTTLYIALTTDTTVSNYRFVRLLLTVPVTVQNNSSYSLKFIYIVQIKLNGGTTKTMNYSFTLGSGLSKLIGNRSIIFDLMKETIIDDTDNGTTSWC